MKVSILPFIAMIGLFVSAVEASERPLLRYSFDENTSSYGDAVDTGVAPAAPGALTGSFNRWTNTPGYFSCAMFDIRGGGGYVTTTTDVQKIDALPAMTITLWLNLVYDPAVDDRLLSDLPPVSPVPPAGTGGWDLKIVAPLSGALSADNFRISFGIFQSFGTVVQQQFSHSPSLDADNKWVFLAITLDSNGYQQYYTGTETAAVSQIGNTTIFSFTLTDNNSELRIAGTAGEPSTNRSPPSFIDDVRIYGSALSIAELDEVRRDNLEILTLGAVPGFHGIKSLRPGSCDSQAEAVSADGSTVVGRGSSSGGSSRAITWRNGVMTALPQLPNGSHCYGKAVSADGSVVAGYCSLYYPDLQAARWKNGVAEPLGYLPGGGNESYAWGISNDGETVAGYDSIGASHAVGAFRWVPGGMQQLPALGSQVEAMAFAVSSDGATIVGIAANDQLTGEACRWDNGVITGLGDLPGGTFQSWANAISADKSTIVGCGVNDLGQEACLWRNGPPQALGVLPGGSMYSSSALAVSGNGLVVVGESRTAIGNEAFIWDPLHGMRNLREVLANDYGLDVTGWQLIRASGISADGTVIVGFGKNPVGVNEGWIARLPALPGGSRSADLNGDNDVDIYDIEMFEACATGPGVPYDAMDPPESCGAEVGLDGSLSVDFDRDGDVDQVDFASRMQVCFSGENIPAASECLE